MAYHLNFMTGQTLGVDHLNEIVSRLMTAGVIFGSAQNPCMVERVNDTYRISPGKAVFANGVVMEVTTTTSIAVAQNTACEIYLAMDTASNNSYPACSAQLPQPQASLLTVWLASVAADGMVTDRRQWSVGRVPRNVPNHYYQTTIGLYANRIPFVKEKLIATHPLDRAGYRYLLYRSGFVDLEQQNYYKDTYEIDASLGGMGVRLRFELDGTNLHVFGRSVNPDGANLSQTIDVTLL